MAARKALGECFGMVALGTTVALALLSTVAFAAKTLDMVVLKALSECLVGIVALRTTEALVSMVVFPVKAFATVMSIRASSMVICASRECCE